MTVIEIKVDDDISKKIFDFLKRIPKQKIEYYTKTDIPYISDDEQYEIEDLLDDPDTRISGKKNDLEKVEIY